VNCSLEDLIGGDFDSVIHGAVGRFELGSVQVSTDRHGISFLAILYRFGLPAEKGDGKSDRFCLEIPFGGFPHRFGFQKQSDYEAAFFCLGKFGVSSEPTG
jgi:hypothetical protein